MSTTRLVNIKYDLRFDAYIGRVHAWRGHFGNRTDVEGHDGYFGNYAGLGAESREAAIEQYRVNFERRIQEDPDFLRRIESLRGKALGCWCSPLPCHGDVIINYLNRSER